MTGGGDRNDLPLSGIRVLAMEHAVAGPIATRQLADLGADVVKVERPGHGDFARGYDRAVRGMSSFFIWLNRGKRSVALDVKQPGAGPILARLAARSDVVLQNLAPGAAARLGLSYEALAPTHPGIVVCDISGYGEGGPYDGRRAYDLLIQAEAGLFSVTGTPETPSRAGISAADIATGMHAFSGILAALLRRERTGKGAHLRIAMLEAMAEWTSHAQYQAAYGGGPPERRADGPPNLAPYGTYSVRGGKVLFGIQNDLEWVRFCQRVLDRPDLAADPRFATNVARVANRAPLTRLIEDAFAALDATAVTARLDAADIANGRLNDATDVWNHPQLAGRNRWRDIGTPVGPVRAMLPAIAFDDVESAMGDVPALGQHTEQVLLELGCSAEDLLALQQGGAIV
jgi:itaconate CoA-transferase